MFGPWIEAYTWLKSSKPTFKLSWPHPNYITLHYAYLIILSLIGSIIIYPAKNMAYIDALFFSAGAATQSGLNTINVNDIYLYQQIALYLICMIANPIFINTFVVFVRLYWFEKRFQSVVMETQRLRRTRTKGSLKNSRGKEDGDLSVQEAGLAGRKILVINPGQATIDDALHKTPGSGKVNMSGHAVSSSSDSDDRNDDDEQNEGSSGNTARSSSEAVDEAPEAPFRRDITFADEVRHPRHTRTFSSSDPVQPQISKERNIAFLENQRNPTDKGVLYIPGPRDFDRGITPQQLADEANNNSPVTPRTTGRAGRFRNRRGSDAESDATTRIGRSLTFDTALSSAKQTFGRLNPTRTDAKSDGAGDEEDPMKTQGLRRRGRRNSFASFVTTKDEVDGPLPYLSYQPTIGRNSTFVNLTEEQREELGGIEYRSLKTLAVILCTYFVGFHLLGLVILTPWYVTSNTWGPIAAADGFSRSWWGIFTAGSAFNDLGFTLTPDSMLSFQFAVLPLLLMSFLIIIGNTGFPCMLRFVIWLTSIVVPRSSGLYEELRFLLDHPRRCFTLLFPAQATWWLFWILVILNGVDLIFFIILDLHDDIISVLPGGIRVLDGLFQAASTRTAGFAVVNLALLQPSIQVSYLVMMYISVLPIAISVRRTNVYEEKSLGVYAGEQEDEEDPANQSYVGAHLRRQLSFDLWYVFLGLFIVAIVESARLQSGDSSFSLFAVLFEIVSAYGTVGLSLGYPTVDTSLSSQFHTLSKLIVVAMMIRGRHRGLPYSLDKAILLPSEGLQEKEEAEASRRLARRASLAPSFQTNGGPTRVNTNGSAPSSVRRPSAGGGNAYAYNNNNNRGGDSEKAPDETESGREHFMGMPPNLTRRQTNTNEKVGDVADWAPGSGSQHASHHQSKAQKVKGDLGKLMNQLLSAGPAATKKARDYDIM